jgi:hypothetical protein
MNISSLTLAVALVAVVGCREHSPPAAPTSTAADAEQVKYQRWFAEARQWEANADVVLTVEETHGTNSVRLVRPALSAFTNELSTAPDFWALSQAVPQHESVVIRMWGVGWDTNRLAHVATHLHAVGFDSVRAVALRWGQSLPGPSL